MTAPEVGTTGMPCRMPLIRSRPWISDSVWCIHESLPAVASIAKMLPLNGLWRFTADGPERLADTRWPDLSAFMVHVCARADDPVEPVAEPPIVADDIDSVTDEMVHGQRCFVTTAAGAVHAANLSIVATIDRFTPGLTWKVTPPEPSQITKLVAIDHTGRPRAAVACLDEEGERST